jgi:WhiB family redox-sensing transcriptional regulator
MSQLDTLLDAIGAAPVLPGARCRGRHHLFDDPSSAEDPETVNARHTQALGLCERCPSLTRCADWFNSLEPNKRPTGAVAGQINPQEQERRPSGRPRKAVS